MNLIELKTKEEFDSFYNQLAKLSFEHHEFWLGLKRQRDYHEPNIFAWDSNHERVTYTNWAPGEPTDHHNFEDCVYAKSVSQSYYWNDNYCGNPFSVACFRLRTKSTAVGDDFKPLDKLNSERTHNRHDSNSAIHKFNGKNNLWPILIITLYFKIIF